MSKDKLGQGAWWQGWEQALEGAWELDQGTRASYRHIILAFKAFCDQHGGGVSIQQARAFVQSEHLARGAGPAEVQQWKEALSWAISGTSSVPGVGCGCPWY